MTKIINIKDKAPKAPKTPMPKFAPNTGLIMSATVLSAHISATLRQYTSNGLAVHQAVVSSLYHACIHGDPSLLNRVFQGLRTNDQQAVKLWVRRVFIINGLDGNSPEGLPSDQVVKACQAGEVLAHKRGEFVIVAGPNHTQAKTLAALCAKRFISPDGTVDRLVLQRNNFAEVRTLGDIEVLKKIIQLSKSLKGSDKVTVDVSAKTQDFIYDIAGKAETMLQQYS